MNRLLALAVVLALGSGISCAPEYDCCQTKVVKGAADSSLDGSYELARKEGSPVESCVDGCVYNKEGEEYCFKECSTGCNHKVDCPVTGSTTGITTPATTRVVTSTPVTSTTVTSTPVTSTTVASTTQGPKDEGHILL